jgi:hypothetical protein
MSSQAATSTGDSGAARFRSENRADVPATLDAVVLAQEECAVLRQNMSQGGAITFRLQELGLTAGASGRFLFRASAIYCPTWSVR